MTTRHANERECTKAGKDLEAIERLAADFSVLGKRARKLGVYIFGGSGSGTIRWQDPGDDRPLVLASIDGNFDGGDGAIRYDSEGLERGE